MVGGGEKALLLLLGVLVVIGTYGGVCVRGATITLGPSDSLSDAVVTASSGDTILLFGGATYTLASSIDVNSKQLNISIASPGADRTAVDCQLLCRAFDVTSGSSLELRGFTITNCIAIEGDLVSEDGGAILVRDGSSLSLVGMRLVLNSVTALDARGGAIAMTSPSGGSLQISNSNFQGNSAMLLGGAIWLGGSVTARIDGSFFTGNRDRQTGSQGGAISMTDDVQSSFVGCQFNLNFADNGGAVSDNDRVVSTFEDCEFFDNSAGYSASYQSNGESQATFTKCLFKNESSVNSGGVSEVAGEARPTFIDCDFRRNSANNGGSISVRGGTLTTIIGCTFREVGRVPATGGHMSPQGNVFISKTKFSEGRAIQGGALYILSPQNITIVDCQFENNAANTGAALSIEGFINEDIFVGMKILKSKFRNNHAASTGGAFILTGNPFFKVDFEDCEFTQNIGVTGGVGTASSGVKAVLQSCTFEKNEASSGAVLSLTNNAVVRIRDGAFKHNRGTNGGSLYQDLQSRYKVEDTLFLDNQGALYGGVLYATNLAEGCSTFRNVRFRNNAALIAGGALYFAAKKPPCREWCNHCEFRNNEAGYGEDKATAPAFLVARSHREDDTIRRSLKSAEVFNVAFDVLDYFNQTLRGFIEMQVNAGVDKNTDLRGTLERQPTREGYVVFDDLRFAETPNHKFTIRFYTEPSTTSVHMLCNIQDCGSDDVLYEKNGIYYCLKVQDPDDIAVAVIYALVAVVLAASFVVLALLYWKRRAKPIANASPVFCAIIVFGIILCAVSATMWTKAEDAMCVLRGWLLLIGSTLMFGALMVREYRLIRIFKNKRLDNSIITNMDLIKGLGAVLSVVILILVLWTSIAPPFRTRTIELEKDDPNNHEITYECDTSFPSSLFVIVLIVIQGLLLGFNCVVAIILRNIPSSFNESKHIAFTIYNAIIMMTVGIVLVIVFSDDKTAVLIIVGLTILVTCTVALVVLFVPKIYLSLLPRSVLIRRLQKEIAQIEEEIRSKEKQANSKTTPADSANPSSGAETFSG